MTRPDRSHHLGELQYAIMRVLWDRGEASVAQVCEGLPAPDRRALTTIATMLSKMEKKGVVAHHSEGRQFIYRACVSESDVHRSMVSDLTERLFRGDARALVSHLITEREIDAEDLERLQDWVADREKEGRVEERGAQ